MQAEQRVSVGSKYDRGPAHRVKAVQPCHSRSVATRLRQCIAEEQPLACSKPRGGGVETAPAVWTLLSGKAVDRTESQLASVPSTASGKSIVGRERSRCASSVGAPLDQLPQPPVPTARAAAYVAPHTKRPFEGRQLDPAPICALELEQFSKEERPPDRRVQKTTTMPTPIEYVGRRRTGRGRLPRHHVVGL